MLKWLECDRRFILGTRITIQGKGIPIGESGLTGAFTASLLVYVPLLLTSSETNQLKSEVGTSFPQLSAYLSYLAQQNVNSPFSLEEAYYSWTCPMSNSYCSFSLLNMIQYVLYIVMFRNKRNRRLFFFLIIVFRAAAQVSTLLSLIAIFRFFFIFVFLLFRLFFIGFHWCIVFCL